MTVSRFHVGGMDCVAEEQLVRMKLDEFSEIRQVHVDLHARQVVIEHATDPARIAAALGTLDLGATHLDDEGNITAPIDQRRERPALVFALAVNAAFFVGELTVGLLARSMALVADAIDMGADASVYALSLAAVGTTIARKKALARASGYLQLGLAAVGLVEVGRRAVGAEELPDTTLMVVVSLLALVANTAVLVVLHRVRTGEAHIQASWIFTANDIKVNVLVIAAAIAVSSTGSALPDLVAGALIFLIVANGARRILRISR